jgi:hypothetical protein
MTPLEALAYETHPILMRDPLAELLGFREAGKPLAFTLDDAGRYAGHLCPTVATAFEMTRAALKRLYGDEMPRRGDVRVTMASAPDQFANGPLARVIGYITGAARDDGFRGLGGRFSRQNLLHFAPDDRPFGSVLFERTDTGASVRLAGKPAKAGGAELGPLLKQALEQAPKPSPEFQQAWAERVNAVLKAGDSLFEVIS